MKTAIPAATLIRLITAHNSAHRTDKARKNHFGERPELAMREYGSIWLWIEYPDRGVAQNSDRKL